MTAVEPTAVIPLECSASGRTPPAGTPPGAQIVSRPNLHVAVPHVTAVPGARDQGQDDDAFVWPPHAGQYTLLQFQHSG